MNATSLDELRQGASLRDPADEKMSQIRELLFGEQQRLAELRMAAIESRLHELETTISLKLNALHSRLEALAGETGAERREAFEELSRSVGDLAERIRQIART